MQTALENSARGYRDFYESVGKRYPEEELVYGTLRGLLRREFILSHLQALKAPFLEIGCNRGYYAGHFKNGLAIGIDIASSVLEAANKRFPQLSLVQADAQHLSFKDGEAANSILCSEVLEHVPESHLVLSECYRVLRPGGLLLLTTPNYNKSRPSWVSIGVLEEYGVQGVNGNHYYHTAFKPHELRAMAERVGFQTIDCGTLEKEVKYATRLPVLLCHLLTWFNRRTLRSTKIENANRRFLERSSLLLYRLCKFLHVNDLIVRFVSEGVRTYLLAQKPMRT